LEDKELINKGGLIERKSEATEKEGEKDGASKNAADGQDKDEEGNSFWCCFKKAVAREK